MENVRLHRRCGEPEYAPHRQFDALVQGLCTSGGPGVRHRVYCFTTERHLKGYVAAGEGGERGFVRYPGGARVGQQTREFHPDVNLTVSLGGHAGKNNVVDAAMKAELRAYLAEADRGDVVVIVSGDADFMAEAREARNRGLYVVALGPADEGMVAARGAYELAHWYGTLDALVERVIERGRDWGGSAAGSSRAGRDPGDGGGSRRGLLAKCFGG